jgi:hypothetical protein
MRLPPLLFVLACATACGGRLPEIPAGQVVSYAEHVEPLILERCLGCHTLEEPEAELVLESGRGYEALVERSSVQVPSLVLVVPGDAASSYLWHKLEHNAAKGQGMPRTLFGAKRLPEDELELIRRWIAEGARP